MTQAQPSTFSAFNIGWRARPDLIGQIVTPHTCHAGSHNRFQGCVCNLIGTPVQIIGMGSPILGVPTYKTADGRWLQEREFTPYKPGKTPSRVGFIVENARGKYLGPNFVWQSQEMPSPSFIHEAQTIKALMIEKSLEEAVRVYPAQSCHEGDLTIGEFFPYSDLAREYQRGNF